MGGTLPLGPWACSPGTQAVSSGPSPGACTVSGPSLSAGNWFQDPHGQQDLQSRSSKTVIFAYNLHAPSCINHLYE